MRDMTLPARFLASFALILATLTISGAGCTRRSEPVTDHSQFLSSLRSSGLSVTEAEEISQPFFSVKGRIIEVNGASVQVFEYDTPEEMEAESKYVSPDGHTFMMGNRVVSVDWIGPPHFYRAGRIMVIYIGDDRAIGDSLETILGRQFAGLEMKRASAR